MKIRINRLCTFTLISLLSLFGFAAQAGAQNSILNQLTGAPKLRGETGKVHKANIAETASGYSYSVLYSFCPATPCTDGANPNYAGLIQDAAGNLYGTTASGGANNIGTTCGPYACGTVFKVDNTGHETVLYSFCSASNCTDGSNPSAGLIQDAAGNLYGTTFGGGAVGSTNAGGTVFKLSPPAQPGGTWTETVLYSFCSETNCTDGEYPMAGLIQDNAGNLYGTTFGGGNSSSNCWPYGGGYSCGTVFKVDNTGHETVLYKFCSASNCADGLGPFAGLIQDAAGNLYGTTVKGGANGVGMVFRVDNTGHETVLYSFCPVANCADGQDPYASLIQDAAGNLYGTTYAGGAYGSGTVFELDNTGQETVLTSFVGNPEAGLIQDAAGNLYGTDYYGDGSGTAFKLAPPAPPGGIWAKTLLYSFCSAGNCTDGEYPAAGLIQDAAGNLYGTTFGGGNLHPGQYCSDYMGLYNGVETYSCGVVFKLSPQLVRTTTVLVTAPNPSNPGQQVTMTATVTAQDGSLPTGDVAFESDGVSIGTEALNGSGMAVLMYAGLDIGTHNLTAVYQGSATLAGSTSNTVGQVVNGVSSQTSVTSAPNPSTFGEAVTLTATVSPSGPPAPTGTVSFTSNGAAISGCTAVPLTSSLTADCMTSTLAVGTDAIVATYSGDGNYAGSGGTLSQLVNPTPSPLQFVAVTPCRLVDTRRTGGPIQGGSSRSFPVLQEGGCNIPTDAAAYSLNVTVVPHGPLGYLTIWPTGEGQPVVSTMNSVDGRVKADAAIVPAGSSGEVSVYVTNTTDVILDIDGYFAPVSGSTLAFYPLPPCRVADTRKDTFPAGLGVPHLAAMVERDFPVLTSSCIPTGVTPQAYSFNFTAVPYPALGYPLGYLEVWPKDQMPQHPVSTLNNLTGTIVANAAIVPAGTDGEITAFANNDTELIIDIDGYFAPAGQGGLSLYPAAPCRVIDTRHVGNGQPFSGTLTPPVDVVNSPCGPPAAAQAYVFNATVVPQGALGYLTLWPDGTDQPVVSTLNAFDGSITNNMAIVPSTNGEVDAYAGSGITQLILDISSYFAP